MSNGARHAIGVVVGLIAIPVIIYGLAYFGGWALRFFQMMVFFPEALIGITGVAIIGGLLALLTTSRMSPLAALIAGVGVGAWGLLMSIPGPAQAALNTPIGPVRPLEAGNVHLFLLGGLLTVSALFPERWRSAAPRDSWGSSWEEGAGRGPGHMRAPLSPREEAERPPFQPGPADPPPGPPAGPPHGPAQGPPQGHPHGPPPGPPHGPEPQQPPLYGGGRPAPPYEPGRHPLQQDSGPQPPFDDPRGRPAGG